MSDTQAIAIVLARSKNEKLLQLCSGKFVLFSHKHLKVFGKFDLVGGVQYSNLYWQPVKNNVFLGEAWSYLHSKPTGKVTEYSGGNVTVPVGSAPLPSSLLAGEELEPFPDWEGIGSI